MSSASLATPVILVGCGAVAQQFYLPTLRVLQQAGELTVHSLVDPSAAARARLASAFPHARSVANLAELSAPDGALAIIASPPRFHPAQTLEALGRGWHVLCEKPMAPTAAEAEAMLVAARSAGRLLAVGLYKRFFPASACLRTLCEGNIAGPLQEVIIAEGGPFRWPAASKSFFDRSQSSGGVLLDIGVHVLDLLISCLGEPVEVAYADDAMGGMETNCLIELGFAQGARGRIHLSRDWATPQRYVFRFARGTVSWRVNDANGLTLQLDGLPAALEGTLLSPLSVPSPYEPAGVPMDTNARSFIAQLRNVLAAMAGREALLVPGEAALLSSRLIEDCYARKRLLHQPWLTPEESRRAQQIATQSPASAHATRALTS